MRRRAFIRSMAAAPAAGLFHFPCGFVPQAPAQPRGGMAQAGPFSPSEGANNPFGVAQGVHPGRVAWVRDTKATRWDGTTGKWWEDAYSDQAAAARMMSRALRDLTGRKNDKQAWDTLFRHFNETHRAGGSGYRPGEKIAVKINCNQDRSAEWGVPRAGGPPGGFRGGPPRPALNGLPSPHVVAALVNQLIQAGGVRGEDILLFEVAQGRNIGRPIYERIRANSNPQFQQVRFLVNNDYGLGGRLSPEPDESHPIHFSKAEVPVGYLPRQVTEAKYMVNLAILRAHGMAGLTLTGKNHFGSVHFPNDGGWTPRVLHPQVLRTQAMGSYNCLVDLMGHPHLGGKSMLYMLDGLYASAHNEGNVIRFASLGDTWAASLLASQDPVAIDSVGLDILRNEPRATEVRGNADNYLHEAAQAARPPSGTVYDPGKTGRSIASLGVHEHWNNAADRKYSRNLGRKEGIELIAALG